MAIERNPRDMRFGRNSNGKNTGTTTIGRLMMIVFALPFAGGGGVFFVSLVYPDIRDWIDTQSWHVVQGELLSADMKRNSSSKSTTFQAQATYRYDYQGQLFTGNRVAISSSADNIGSFQEDLANQLVNAHRNRLPLTVYVNPEDPSQAIINRDMRWGLLTLKMVFVVVFGGVGFGLIIFAIKKPKAMPITDNNQSINDPSLIKKEWASPVILSGAKTVLYVMWGITLFWNLLSLPAAFQIPAEVSKGEYGILVILIFNVIGIGLLVMAIRKTLEWRRFGRTPLTMDPHPGAIGGHVGGSVDIKLPYSSEYKFSVTLSNVRSYVSGSGKNRSRHESVKWQDNMIASNEPSQNGTQVRFRFDVPDNLMPSEEHSSDYYKWYVNLKAELPGVDLERRFEIPVLATGEKSRYIPDDVSSEHREDLLTTSNLPAEVSYQQGGMELYFPMGRAWKMGLGMLVFGAFFSGTGVFLGFEYLSSKRPETMMAVMGTIFFLVGSLIEIIGFYTLVNSLWVRLDNSGIKTKRCLFGIAIFQRSVMRSEVADVVTKSGTQSGSTIYYSIFAKTRGGRSIKIGESFIGAGSANAMAEKMKQTLDL